VKLFDRLPTRWLFTGVAGLLLLVSAAFGGLDDAPTSPPPTIEAGDTATGVHFSVAVSRVLLIDALPELGLTPPPGSRLLVVGATVENQRTMPLRLATFPLEPDSVLPVGVAGIEATTPAMTVAVLDDGAEASPLQPGVPADVVYVWEVAADALAAGDDIRVDILDRTVEGRATISFGERLSDPFVIAHVDVPLGDVGAGADATDGGGG
jgi:hypothetical protein